jgi:hypothetical protein
MQGLLLILCEVLLLVLGSRVCLLAAATAAHIYVPALLRASGGGPKARMLVVLNLRNSTNQCAATSPLSKYSYCYINSSWLSSTAEQPTREPEEQMSSVWVVLWESHAHQMKVASAFMSPAWQ